MEYKVGDRVRIRSDLVAGKNYGGFDFIEEMEEYKGKTLKIIKVVYDWEEMEDYYILDINDNRISWTKQMLEGYEMTKIIAGKDFAKEIENKRIEILENGLVKVLEPNVWKPRVGENYFFLNHSGYVLCATWEGNKLALYRLYNGNVFKTKEIATKVRDTTFKFKKLAYEEMVDWEDEEQSKYYLWYNHYARAFDIYSCMFVQEQGRDHFKDKEKLENLVKEVGEADVIKYYLRIGVNE